MYPEPGWVVIAGTVSDRDVATEPTRMYLWRVLAITTHSGSPPKHLSGELVKGQQWSSVQFDYLLHGSCRHCRRHR